MCKIIYAICCSLILSVFLCIDRTNGYLQINFNVTDTNDQNATKLASRLGFPKLKFFYDDGAIEEQIDPEEDEKGIEQKEKGTLHFPRGIVKSVSNTVGTVTGKVVNKVTDAFKFVTTSAGLDTNRTLFSGTVDAFKDHIKAIYPGTRWCGDGDKAKSYTDLGTFESTDKCCRAHDKCFDSMGSGLKKYGLENTGLFTRSHCDCDNAFYECLKAAKNIVAGNIGFTYFTVLGPQCFKEDFVATGCGQYSRGKCIRYRFNEAKGKLYQWFDSPLYI